MWISAQGSKEREGQGEGKTLCVCAWVANKGERGRAWGRLRKCSIFIGTFRFLLWADEQQQQLEIVDKLTKREAERERGWGRRERERGGGGREDITCYAAGDESEWVEWVELRIGILIINFWPRQLIDNWPREGVRRKGGQVTNGHCQSIHIKLQANRNDLCSLL